MMITDVVKKLTKGQSTAILAFNIKTVEELKAFKLDESNSNIARVLELSGVKAEDELLKLLSTINKSHGPVIYNIGTTGKAVYLQRQGSESKIYMPAQVFEFFRANGLNVEVGGVYEWNR